MSDFPLPSFQYERKIRSILEPYDLPYDVVKSIISIMGDAVDENVEYLRIPRRKYLEEADDANIQMFNVISREVNAWANHNNTIIDILKWK